VTLYDAMLNAEVTADAFLSLAQRALPLEKNELNVSRILAYVREAYWRYSAAATRMRVASQLEPVLRAGLESAAAPSLKSTWFSALRDVAQTPGTIEWLKRVWAQEDRIPGLTLSETDFIRLAEELAVRDVSGASTILDRQYERTNNPDRKAQFAFVRPALSGDARERDAWFTSLADVANRRHEPWVLEGLRYLHHPLRAAASEKFIEPSLLLLREIQRTGDIFFPKRWMDASLSGHQSAGAAATVRAFLDHVPPDYPERLRRVILSSADDLFRASKR
jgi:aminopeptidase N